MTDDQLGSLIQYGAASSLKNDVMDSTGAIVLGQRTYAISVATNQRPYGRAVRVPTLSSPTRREIR